MTMRTIGIGEDKERTYLLRKKLEKLGQLGVGMYSSLRCKIGQTEIGGLSRRVHG